MSWSWLGNSQVSIELSRRPYTPLRLLFAAVAALSFGAMHSPGAVQFTSLYSFTGDGDGCFPWGTLIQASDGNLYGTANYGGANFSIFGYGTVFQMGLDGTFNPLYPFANNGDGDHPWLSGLVELSDGTFFGTTSTGGDYHNGVIFNVDPHVDDSSSTSRAQELLPRGFGAISLSALASEGRVSARP
jgi:uncharacterized repeat protein (TIGR03803 family)